MAENRFPALWKLKLRPRRRRIPFRQSLAAADCGARFTGAGGGGCVWAFGRRADIEKLRPIWASDTESVNSAALLDFTVDTQGMAVNI